MDKFDCSCGGMNDKCFRCFGTGLVESSAPIIGRPHRPLTPRPDTLTSKKKKRKRKNSLAQDQTKLPTKLVEFSATESLAMGAGSAYVNCSQCGALLRKTRFEHHMTKVHSPEPKRSDDKQKISSTFANVNLGSKPLVPPCPVCKKQLLTIEELRSHIVDGHGKILHDLTERRLRDRKAAKKVSKPKLLLPNQLLSRRTSIASKLKQHSLSPATDKDDVDALDHPSRLPGSYGTGRRK